MSGRALASFAVIAILTAKVVHSAPFQFSKDVESEQETYRKPIVMVPGVMGSRLQAKLNMTEPPGLVCSTTADWYDIWLQVSAFYPWSIYCWLYNISLRFNVQTKTAMNQKGVETRVPDFGNTTGFEYIIDDPKESRGAYFNELVDSLARFGYERGNDLKGAPFDWRYTPKSRGKFLEDLSELVEKNYYEHKNQKVVVFGHSMGNLFIYYMLKHKPQAWKDKFIDSFVSVSAPYIGSVKALKAITSGETEGYDSVLPSLPLRNLAQTFPSSYLLLPRPEFWPKEKVKVVDTLVSEYSVFDYKALFKRIACDDCWELWQKFGNELGDLSAPNVPVHCVYSTQVPTPEVLVYESDTFPTRSPYIKSGDGDGSVPTFSSSYCLKWAKQQSQPVYDVPMPGNTHLSILNNSTLQAYVKNVSTHASIRKNATKFNIL